MSLQGRRVLVSGGAGYIGSHATLALIEAGADVTVIDNLSTGVRWAVPDSALFIEGDIGDQDLVSRALNGGSIEAIMHFAGSVVVPESVENPLKYYGNNTANSRNLIECAVKAGVPHMIFSSTAAVYGVPDTPQVTEQTPTVPINPYGMSKLMTEYMLRDTAAAHDFCYAALRYFNVAGGDPKGRTGQSTPNATHLIKVACEAASGKRPGVSVFGTDFPTRDGTGVRDYIHVSDLVDAHVETLKHLIAHPGESLVMNCGYSRGFSVREVLAAVEKVTGQTLDVTDGPRRPGDPAELVSNTAKLRTTLGWRPRYDDLETIVRTAYAWERKLAERL